MFCADYRERETISHFLLCRLISTKKHSLFPELNFELKSFDGSPFLMKRISPPPFRSLSNLDGLEYPSILNYACGNSILNCASEKDESSFVSDSINISILSLTNGTKDSNLFRKELTLRWLLISLSGFYFLISLIYCFLRSFKMFDLRHLIEAI